MTMMTMMTTTNTRTMAMLYALKAFLEFHCFKHQNCQTKQTSHIFFFKCQCSWRWSPTMLRPPLDSSTLVPAWRRVHKVPAVWSSAPRGPRAWPSTCRRSRRRSPPRRRPGACGSRRGRGSEIRVLGASGQRIRAPNIFYGEYSGWWNIARLKIGDDGHLKKPMDN